MPRPKKVKAEVVEEDGPRLNRKQQRFVEEYMLDLNAPAAAVRAGYASSYALAGSTPLMGQPKIQKAIEKKMAELSAANAQKVNWIITQLAEIAADDMQRTSDRLKAMEMLGKHLGMWQDIVKVDNTITVRIEGAVKELSE